MYHIGLESDRMVEVKAPRQLRTGNKSWKMRLARVFQWIDPAGKYYPPQVMTAISCLIEFGILVLNVAG